MITKIAKDLGYLELPEDSVVELEKLKNYENNRVCVLTTGSQGESMSGLFRMANASHKLNVGEGDTVIISASAIPGNELGVSRVINQLYQRGVRVVYDRMADVHVSGHARREELRLMFTLTKPKFFIPVHGEAKQLYQHADLAKQMGIPEENIIVPELGGVIELNKSGIKANGSVHSGSVLIDGSSVGEIGDAVLKDRKQLSESLRGRAVLRCDTAQEENRRAYWPAGDNIARVRICKKLGRTDCGREKSGQGACGAVRIGQPQRMERDKEQYPFRAEKRAVPQNQAYTDNFAYYYRNRHIIQNGGKL